MRGAQEQHRMKALLGILWVHLDPEVVQRFIELVEGQTAIPACGERMRLVYSERLKQMTDN